MPRYQRPTLTSLRRQQGRIRPYWKTGSSRVLTGVIHPEKGHKGPALDEDLRPGGAPCLAAPPVVCAPISLMVLAISLALSSSSKLAVQSGGDNLTDFSRATE